MSSQRIGVESVGRTKRSAVPAGRPIAGTALRLVRPTTKSSFDKALVDFLNGPYREVLTISTGDDAGSFGVGRATSSSSRD
jgi:hypothetical protein